MDRSAPRGGRGATPARGLAGGGAAGAGAARRASGASRAVAGGGAHRSVAFRVFKWAALATVAGLFAGVLALGGVALYFSSGLPDLESLADYHPPVVTRILDADGKVIGEIFTERRTVVPFSAIPPVLVHALLAAEDANFYTHKGLDYAGMVRAFLKNVAAGHFVQGGSTITQQVVKTFLLTPEKSIRRKAQEVLLARRLEEEFSKNDILALYLNQIYLGHGRYGVEEAAHFYFGHSVAEVTLPEAAMLAALPKAPVNYSPLTAPEKAKARRDWVLDKMAEHGFAKAAEVAAAKAVALPTEGHEEASANLAPEIVDAVRAELAKRFSEDALPALGAEVHTTIRAALQEAAAKALMDELRKLDKRRGFDRPRVHLNEKKAWEKIAADTRSGEPLAGEHFDAVVLAVVPDTGDERLVLSLAGHLGELRLTGDPRLDGPGMGAPSARFAPGDVVPAIVAGMVSKPYALKELPAGAAVLGAGVGAELRDRLADLVRFRAAPALGPQGALVSIDPTTREIVAMVGGAPYTPGGLDRVTGALRPPGSAFKPLLYSAALATKRFTAASLVSDAPSPYADGYDPDNAEPAAEGKGVMRLRDALAGSVNTVAVRVLEKLGEPALRDIASAAFGLTRPLHPGLASALGVTEVTPLELCNAYAVFASGGKLGPPLLVKKIVGRDGKTLFEATTDVDQVLDPEVAYVVTSMMTSVVEAGTGKAARLGRPVAGKTGTTNDARNLWFGGFTPELVAVVWVGYDMPTPLKKEFGGTVAAPAWRSFMKVALADKPPSFFARPPGVATVLIDPATGLRAWDGQPDAIEEVFINGTEPVDSALPPGSVTVDDWAMGGGTPGAGASGGAPVLVGGTGAPESRPRAGPPPAPRTGGD
jgi:penicillin-binding protein 1A